MLFYTVHPLPLPHYNSNPNSNPNLYYSYPYSYLSQALAFFKIRRLNIFYFIIQSPPSRLSLACINLLAIDPP